ncbi:unnamed protein product, partial [Urochloa humidicola]
IFFVEKFSSYCIKGPGVRHPVIRHLNSVKLRELEEAVIFQHSLLSLAKSEAEAQGDESVCDNAIVIAQAVAVKHVDQAQKDAVCCLTHRVLNFDGDGEAIKFDETRTQLMSYAAVALTRSDEVEIKGMPASSGLLGDLASLSSLMWVLSLREPDSSSVFPSVSIGEVSSSAGFLMFVIDAPRSSSVDLASWPVWSMNSGEGSVSGTLGDIMLESMYLISVPPFMAPLSGFGPAAVESPTSSICSASAA